MRLIDLVDAKIVEIHSKSDIIERIIVKKGESEYSLERDLVNKGNMMIANIRMKGNKHDRLYLCKL